MYLFRGLWTGRLHRIRVKAGFPSPASNEAHKMDGKTTTGKLEGQLSDGLLSNKIQLKWWQKQELVLALLRWYWRSRLRPLVEETCSLPWRIASSMSLLPGTVGLEIPGPEGIEGPDQHRMYTRAGISCIEGLAKGNRWWGPRDTYVASQAFRQGATFGLHISGIRKPYSNPRSL